MTIKTELSNNDILENIISASENSNFHVVEDIYDNSNNKLLAKGYKITPKIRERLFDRILKKPIETSIKSDNSVTGNDLASQALEIIKSIPILKELESNIEVEANELRYLNLDPLASLLLSVIRDTKPKDFTHLIFVTLLGRAIGRELKLDEYDMSNLSQACILHDIGHLYASIPHDEKLTEVDWRKVMVHPIIGGSVVRMYMNYPHEVSIAIQEHHERCNGNGYPKRIDANKCSIIGQVLILVEAIAGILKSGVDSQNAHIVLKLSTGDYPDIPLDAFNSIIISKDYIRTDANLDFTQDALKNIFQMFNEISLKIAEILRDNHDYKIVEIAKHLEFRILKLRQAIYASGITYYLEDDNWQGILNDQTIRIELEITTKEIGWQLQDIIRDIVLRLANSNLDSNSTFNDITEQLTKVAEIIFNQLA